MQRRELRQEKSETLIKEIREWAFAQGVLRRSSLGPRRRGGDATLGRRTLPVLAVAALADSRVLSAPGDCTLRVWDLAAGALVGTLEGHTWAVDAVATLADGRVVSASSDRTLRLWDLAAGAAVAVFTLDAPVIAVTVAASGVVIAGDSSGRLHFLNVVG